MNLPSRTSLRSRMPSVLAASLALSLAACGGGGGTPVGIANFQLTDAPVCSAVQSVFITVDAIELIGANASYSLTLPQPQQPIDLTSLVNGQTLSLGNVSVPAGTYQQLRLILAPTQGNGPNPANYVLLSGSSTPVPLNTPSAQQSGYKINGQFAVAANGQVNLTVDFNACRSVVVAGSSNQYILKPVLNLTDDDQSGSITGNLPTSDAGAMVMAEDSSGHILKATVATTASTTATSASFTLAPLPASSIGYNVVIAPPAPSTSTTPSPNFAPDAVLGVPVVAGQVTPLSTSASPLPAVSTTADAYYSGTINLPSSADALVVAQEPLNSTTTISIAQSNGIETSSSTTQTYAMELPSAAPDVATYSANGLIFTQSVTAPTVTISAYDSAGATGSTMTMTNALLRLSGTGDDTYYFDR